MQGRGNRKPILWVIILVSILGMKPLEAAPSGLVVAESKSYSDYAGPPPADLSLPESRILNLEDSSSPVYMAESRNLWHVLAREFEFQEEASRPAVAYQVQWFLAHRKILNKMLNNAVPYLYYVHQQVLKKKFPAEIALLPLVESGYSPYAYSSAGATGLWQLMPATAASDGLRINWWYDGRRDVLVSTHSALAYLKFLHVHFHHWPLAISAYNAGQGTVQNAVDYNIRMNQPADFWSLPLPLQTRDYFPKLLALSSIILNAKHYGVDLPYIPDQPYFTPVTLHSQVTLGQLSEMSGLSEEVVQRLNPGFRRWATEPNNAYPILVPVSHFERFKLNLKKTTGKEDYTWMYHQARGGETLRSIAANYHVPLNLLAKVNGLNEDASLPTNESLLVPVRLHRRFNQANEQAIHNDQVKPTLSLPEPEFAPDKQIDRSDTLEQMLGKLQSA